MAESQSTAIPWLAQRFDRAMPAELPSHPGPTTPPTPLSLQILQPPPRLALAEVPDGSPGFELGRPGPGPPSGSSGEGTGPAGPSRSIPTP